MHVVYSMFMIIGTFSLSTVTAFAICYYNNYDFVNPQFKFSKCLERMFDVGKNVPILLLQSVGFMYVVSDNIIPYGNHSYYESMVTMIKYTLFIEANYYLYHRFIHAYFYSIHKKHHTNIVVFPFDTFYLSELDDFALVVSLGLPLIFIQVSRLEQFLILYIYITSAYLSHSTLFWNHHDIHHRLLFCNYCILFPVFDIIFGSYKIE
jgi:sterol desaturase/sphingolipid hydroxylase (fatty acid hydroxylase superfamily)